MIGPNNKIIISLMDFEIGIGMRYSLVVGCASPFVVCIIVSIFIPS